MDNRIDHLFKERLGGTVSADVPANKAATLDALTKSKGGFRLWMLIPILLLIGGSGWAVYHFQIGNDTSARHTVYTYENNVSAAPPVADETNSTHCFKDKQTDQNNIETAKSSVISTTPQTSTFLAVSYDRKNSKKTLGTSSQSAPKYDTREGVDPMERAAAPDQELTERFYPETEVIDELPNDHSVAACLHKNGSF